MIGSPTEIKDIFRDIDAASEIVADSDQFNQGTAASLMEVVIMEMMMREKTVTKISNQGVLNVVMIMVIAENSKKCQIREC